MGLYIGGAVIVYVFSALLSMAGLGAAFIFVPLFYWIGVDLHQAMSVALFLNVISLGFASISYWRGHLVKLRAALPILVAAVILSPLGAYSSKFFNRRLLLELFVAFLFFAAYMMLFYRPHRGSEQARTTRLGFSIGVGSLAGYVGGLLGVGGGNIIVPALTWLGEEPKIAAGTTAFVVVFSSLTGFLGRVSVAGLNWTFLGVTSVAAVAGALTGAWLMQTKLTGAQLKKVIGVALVLMAAKVLYDLFK